MDGVRRCFCLNCHNLDVKTTVGYHGHILPHAKRRCHGAKHSPPGDKFQKSRHGAKHSPPGSIIGESEGPPASMVTTPCHQVFYCQIVSKWRIPSSDPNDFQRIFQLYPPQVLNPSADGGPPAYFRQHVRDLEKIDFLILSSVKSCGVQYHSLQPPMPYKFP